MFNQYGTKVKICTANSSLQSVEFLQLYDISLYGHFDPGSKSTEFVQALIDKTITDSPGATWAKDHANSNLIIKRVDEDHEDCLIYDIFVYMNDHNLTFWRLKYEHN